jgi:ornithine cyclodeaminase/alanine dehydrogenase
MSDIPVTYLSSADIASLDIGLSEVTAALEEAFRLKAEEKIFGIPKASAWIDAGHGFQTLSVVDRTRHVAALKWVGLVPPGMSQSANVNSTILLSDTRTGELLCIMDAQRATGLRTAGMSAIAARHLARGDAASIGFIGAGVQARSHLDAFLEVLPSLTTLRVHSARESSAAAFADDARRLGLDAKVAEAAGVLAESDVIVSTVPLAPGFRAFLVARAIKPGAFVASIDLGRPWIDDSLDAIDVTVLDDEGMRHAAKPGDFIPSLGDADAVLADLVVGRHPGRATGDQRTMLVGSGSAVADLAIGHLIHQKALASRLGRSLPR